MPALKREVTSATLDEVEIVYLNRDVSSWWNARRSANDTATFCGWYWIKGRQEGGPFRTRSATLRDAYYQFVLHRSTPRTWNEDTVKYAVKTPPPPNRAPVKKRKAIELRAVS